MSIETIEITQLRNLNHVKLSFNPSFNLIAGLNGSGKTSLLEAIYLLGLGRSFRTRIAEKLIQHATDKLQLFGSIKNKSGVLIPVGLEKSLQLSSTRIRVAYEDSSAAVLAELLPLQLIYPDSYRLLDAGPKHRRQFIDWGLFHVEHQFMEDWCRFKRTLLQRNAALKRKLTEEQIQIWDEELISTSESIETMRRRYFALFMEVFIPLCQELNPALDIQLSYKQGWSEKLTLGEALVKNIRRDQELGYTQAGPQRSDLQFLIHRHGVHDILSRGQQKSLIYALRLTQGLLLKQLTGKSCVYLFDDLLSELDTVAMQRVLSVLHRMNAQVFITGVDVAPLREKLEGHSLKMFHVERGVYCDVAGVVA